MHLTRHIAVAGIAAMSLSSFGLAASPALAKGGGGDAAGDINNTVIQIAPGVTPVTTKGGGGGGGGGKPTKCTSVLVDPVTQTFIGTCTTNRV
jgi:hypothetical protein